MKKLIITFSLALILAGCGSSGYSYVAVELTYQNGQIDTVQFVDYMIHKNRAQLDRYGYVQPSSEVNICGVRSCRVLKK